MGLVFVLAAVTATGAFAAVATAAATPGTLAANSRFARAAAPLAATTAIAPVLSDSGQISLSVDGLGSSDPAGGTVNVQKPFGGTVRKALLLAASTGFGGYAPVDGDVTVDGNPVTWDPSHTIANSIGSVNVLADVTSLVKPKVDGAAPGTVGFQVAEPTNSGNIDGEILAVVLNDPTSTTSNSVALLYGAQNTAGDTFPIALASPVDRSNSNQDITMGLGISYGFQVGSTVNQFSRVSVNSQPLTSAAGGQDDCIQKYQPTPNYTACDNGTLLTVGGVGDSTANPPDPTAAPDTACNPRCDDELYDVFPFLNTGDTSASVNTVNPSTDDNIFFGSLFFKGLTAIVGEGIVLSPPSAVNPVGTNHTLTATAQDANGQRVAATAVTFTATSGPNQRVLGTAMTDASGVATFSYTSSVAGIDTIVASFVDSNLQTQTSNPVTATWTNPSPIVTPPHGTPAIQTGPAIRTTTSQAFLSALLKPGGLTTTYYFQYGIDAKHRLKPTGGIVYDQRTPNQTLGANSAQTAVTANASPLVPNALYHARLVASNSAGTTFGPDIAFKTKADRKTLPKPVLGKFVNASVISGRVFFKLPGASAAKAFKGRKVRASIPNNFGYVPLTEALQLPVRTKIDNEKGKLRLVTASQKKSKTQSGVFAGGLFSIAQKARGVSKALVTLALLEGAFKGAPTYASCKATAHSSSTPIAGIARLSSRVLQTLRSNAHGRFRTRGRYSASTVRGTNWGTRDRCDGTLTIVRRGTVAVTDFTRHRTVLVHAGHRYLAPAKHK